MPKTLAMCLLILAAGIAFFTAIAHISCIFLGPQCFEYQLAPEAIVASAQQGTWLAPVGTLVVSGIFAIWGGYGLAAAGLLRPLPFQHAITWLIAVVCIVRGLLGIQLWLRKPELVSEFANISSWIWFFTGVLFLLGHLGMKKYRAAPAS